MLFVPVQLPHFVREARIVSLLYFSPVMREIRPIRSGRSALAARRSSSMRAFSSAGGNCGGSAARRLRKPCPGRLDPSGFAFEKFHRPAARKPRKGMTGGHTPSHAR